MTVYEKGIGDSLLAPESYNYNIRNYLLEEKNILEQVLHNFDEVLELGCSNGRHARMVLDTDKRYTGVDNVARYISEAKRLYSNTDKASFFCDDIKHFAEYINAGTGNTLFVFPFNIIGNIPDASEIIRQSLSLSDGVLIFTYKTDFHTQSVRADYYMSAGFEDITCTSNKTGVRFTDSQGLNTIAYTEDWFRNIFNESYHHCYRNSFGNIGVAYTNFNI